MDDLIQQGITAFRAGNQAEARKLLITAVKQNPDSERAWGWMYNVANNDQERTHCLKQILRINPKNEKANQRLNELTSFDFPLESPASQPVLAQAQPLAQQAKRPWYRTTVAYVLFFLFLAPLWGLLIATDKERDPALRIIGGIVAVILGCFISWNLCIASVTIMGPLAGNVLSTINSDLTETPMPISATAKVVKPNVQATPTAKKMLILPVGSDLTYKNWTIHVDKVEIKQRIEFNKQVDIPKNGRFAVLHLSVTNSGTSSDLFIPPVESAIIDANGGAFPLGSGLSVSEIFTQNMDVGLQLDPGQTGKILAVYDISSSSKAYLLVNGIDKLGVLLDVP